MARIRIYNNCFESNYEEKEFDFSKPLIEQIENDINIEEYKEYLVECYDPDTQKTFYAPLEDDVGVPSVVIVVDNRVVSADYEVKENDIVSVIYSPQSEATGTQWALGFVGAVIGTIVGGVAGGALGVSIGLGIAGGALIGFAVGWQIGKLYDVGSNTAIGGKEKENLPDVRGAQNQPIVGNPYPFVIGKHLANPFIAADPYTVYTGEGVLSDKGEDAIITVRYCLGYAPMKVTDLKLGDFYLAYNRPHAKNPDQQTLLCGALSSCNIDDSGDILGRWKNNDIKVNIIQQNPYDSKYYYGDYRNTHKDQEIGANALFVCDKKIQEVGSIVYKGLKFPDEYRSNGVFFTDSCPMKFTINLDFPNGAFETYTHTDVDGESSVSEVQYEQIPLWFAVQWRPYNKNNASSDSNGTDYDSWKNIDYWNNHNYRPRSYLHTYTESEYNKDKAAHRGNSLGTASEVNPDWIDKDICNFEPLSGKSSELRLRATVELSNEEMQQMMSADNTMQCAEIRVIRISPNYINEEKSSTGKKGGDSARSYADNLVVTSIVTECFDENEYLKSGTFTAQRTVSNKDYEKFCFVDITAKADPSGNILKQLGEFSCTVESFSPTWDKANHKWLPEGVTKTEAYYGYYTSLVEQSSMPSDIDKNLYLYKDGSIYKRATKNTTAVIYSGTWSNRKLTPGVTEIKVDKAAYEKARQLGFSWNRKKLGSNFKSKIEREIYPSTVTTGDSRKYYLQTEKYCDATVASGFMLGAVGAHNGAVGVGYEDIDLLSVGECWEAQQAVKDGSVYQKNDGVHAKGDEVVVKYEANGYIYQALKFDELLRKLAVAGRCVYTHDNIGRYRLIMDKPVPYSKGAISQQNCVSLSSSYTYAELPAGLRISFQDENDGYNTNAVYCWADGNDITNYKGQIESYSFDLVTNPIQNFSLGRYALANRILNREVLSAKVSAEGFDWGLGDVINVNSDELFLGEGSGRIQEVLEVDGTIYGFVMDSTYNYSGLLKEGLCSQGVQIVQPKQYGNGRVVAFRLATPNTSVIIGDITYILEKGITNLVIFDTPVSRNNYDFKTGNVVMFGEYGKESERYRIIKYKPEKDGYFTCTLIQYTDKLYNYGAELPSFQTNMTLPPVLSDGITLSEVPTTLSEILEQNSEIIDQAINNVELDPQESLPPDTPAAIAIAHSDYITLIASISNSGINNNIKKVVWEFSDDDFSSHILEYVTYEKEDEYKIDRSFFKHPEKEEVGGEYYLSNKNEDWHTGQGISLYKVRAKVFNYNKDKNESKFSTPVYISCNSDYTSWIPKKVSVNDIIAGRDGFDITWNCDETMGSDKYNVIVTRPNGSENIFRGLTTKGCSYRFDRLQDRYPEKSDLDGYSVTVLHYNDIYNGISTVVALNIDSYGTWRIPDLSDECIIADIVDRTIMLKLTTLNTSLEYYGNTKYRISIKRGLNELPELNNEGVVLPQEVVPEDDKWYKPNLYGTPLTDINAYKGEEGYIEIDNRFSQTLPLLGQDEHRIINTIYKYQITAFNESGFITSPKEISVTALCTSIRDVVNASASVKEEVVGKLSALSADVGLLSQGGFGDFKHWTNFWALSKMFRQDTGLATDIPEGAFRVGGNNQYIAVVPPHCAFGEVGTESYIDNTNGDDTLVKIKAGNIELTTNGSSFKGGTYIYDSGDSTKRMKLNNNGIIIESFINNSWVSRGNITLDNTGNIMISNADDSDTNRPKNGIYVAGNPRVYHFDGSLSDENKQNALTGNGTFVDSVFSANDFGTAFNGNLNIPTDEQECFFNDGSCIWINDRTIFNVSDSGISLDRSLENFETSSGLKSGTMRWKK